MANIKYMAKGEKPLNHIPGIKQFADAVQHKVDAVEANIVSAHPELAFVKAVADKVEAAVEAVVAEASVKVDINVEIGKPSAAPEELKQAVEIEPESKVEEKIAEVVADVANAALPEAHVEVKASKKNKKG